MTILGSRDQYCVHQSAKKFERGVNEACNLMLGGTDLTKVSAKTLGKDKGIGTTTLKHFKSVKYARQVLERLLKHLV